ncbi:MAG: 2-isopropylmalate synthase, partial [Planctomycetota bacterium]
MKPLIIFDTTLRDGEQAAGASLQNQQKLEIARALERLQVDVIEAGFPVSSEGEFEAVRAIAREVRGCQICALARTVEKDIERAAQALEGAASPRIHVFMATSKIHREHKLKKDKGEILEQSVRMVAFARTFADDVEYSPEDATRTEPEFLHQVLAAVIEAGATTLNIPDTVGWTIPAEFTTLITGIRKNVNGIERARISVHCHDDLGLATSNSLAALLAGADQVECTINGLGERAGNAALEEVVMAVKTRPELFARDVRVETRRLYPTSRLVSRLTGIHVQRNKAIVGENAFAHESGVHQDGFLKKKSTYEIISPESVGYAGAQLVLGKLSGRHAFQERLRILGFQMDDASLDRSFAAFKALADQKKEVYDDDLLALVEESLADRQQTFELVSLHISSGSGTIPTATVEIRKDGKIFRDAACGDGPVDAICRSIDRITGISGRLVRYEVHNLTGGHDSQAECVVVVDHEGRH